MRLQTMLVLMAPFVLVALFHSHRLTAALASGLSGGGRPRLSLIGAGRHHGVVIGGHLPPRRPISPVEEEQLEILAAFRARHSALRSRGSYLEAVSKHATQQLCSLSSEHEAMSRPRPVWPACMAAPMATLTSL